MIEIIKPLPDTGRAGARTETDQRGLFDCREINDLNRIYPFGSLNQRWSGVQLITSALYGEKETAQTSPVMHDCVQSSRFPILLPPSSRRSFFKKSLHL